MSINFQAYFNLLSDDGFMLTNGGSQPQQWWEVRYQTPENRAIYIKFTVGSDTLLWELPFGIQPTTDACRNALTGYLAHLNHALKLAHFALDDRGQVMLIVEMLANTLSFATLKTVFHIIRAYNEHYHDVIQLLATNPELANGWLTLHQIEDLVDIQFER